MSRNTDVMILKDINFKNKSKRLECQVMPITNELKACLA